MLKPWNKTLRLDPDAPELHEDVAVHVFTVLAAMVGVCLTTIGLIRVVVR